MGHSIQIRVICLVVEVVNQCSRSKVTKKEVHQLRKRLTPNSKVLIRGKSKLEFLTTGPLATQELIAPTTTLPIPSVT